MSEPARNGVTAARSLVITGVSTGIGNAVLVVKQALGLKPIHNNH